MLRYRMQGGNVDIAYKNKLDIRQFSSRTNGCLISGFQCTFLFVQFSLSHDTQTIKETESVVIFLRNPQPFLLIQPNQPVSPKQPIQPNQVLARRNKARLRFQKVCNFFLASRLTVSQLPLSNSDKVLLEKGESMWKFARPTDRPNRL